MGEVDEPEFYNLKFTTQQGCSYTMQNYIYLAYMHRLRKFVIEMYYVTCTVLYTISHTMIGCATSTMA